MQCEKNVNEWNYFWTSLFPYAIGILTSQTTFFLISLPWFTLGNSVNLFYIMWTRLLFIVYCLAKGQKYWLQGTGSVSDWVFTWPYLYISGREWYWMSKVLYCHVTIFKMLWEKKIRTTTKKYSEYL